MTVSGIDGVRVFVETDVTSGLPDFALVGDLSPEVREARERVRTALRNCGFEVPPRRITINLAPADLRKEGTAFDLAVAVGILCACGEIKPEAAADTVFLGELGLDGSICRIPGTLPMVLAAKAAGMARCMVPEENAGEAALVDGIDIIPAATLSEAVGMLRDPALSRHAGKTLPENEFTAYDTDFSEINGQRSMRRAAEVAAAGMHNILFVGTPGSGKTMIARRLPTILPDLTWDECLEVTRIHSVSGLTGGSHPLRMTRPFRMPHHNISASALVGGGKYPRPGEVSLADRGILFLDELPEFQKQALEALRQPLEDRAVTVTRMSGSCRFPADFMLCAAMNPCRCGYYPDRSRCSCSESDVRRYMRRISRPLLDRIDICAEAPPVSYTDLEAGTQNESSAAIRERVAAAWEIQKTRFSGSGILFNSQMRAKDIKRFCPLSQDDADMMKAAFEKMNLSARGYHRILKVARTISDLDGSENIKTAHLMEALSYRGMEEKIWG